jgi:hypothetical protein
MITIGWITLVLGVFGFIVSTGSSIAGYQVEFVKKEEEHSIGSITGTMIGLGLKALGIWWIFQMVTSL